MRVHHLNTGTMCPIGRRLVNGTGSIFQRARMVCHCLLIETNDGLALVDTGIGLDDIANPPRLGPKWVRQTTPRLDPAETAVRQVEALGYSRGDVRHLLLTHLDRDHAGGIPDFPNAKVHVHRREYDMAVTRPDACTEGALHHRAMEARSAMGVLRRRRRGLVRLQGRPRARRSRARHPDDPAAGTYVRSLRHRRADEDKWLLHAGDAYFFHGQMQASPKMPLVLGMFQRRADMDRAMRIQNQERLRTLKANHGDAVTIFNSHDPVDYENCRCGQHQEVPAHAGAG